MKVDLRIALAVTATGMCAVVAGVALFSVPAALVVAGLLLLTVGVWVLDIKDDSEESS